MSINFILLIIILVLVLIFLLLIKLTSSKKITLWLHNHYIIFHKKTLNLVPNFLFFIVYFSTIFSLSYLILNIPIISIKENIELSIALIFIVLVIFLSYSIPFYFCINERLNNMIKKYIINNKIDINKINIRLKLNSIKYFFLICSLFASFIIAIKIGDTGLNKFITWIPSSYSFYLIVILIFKYIITYCVFTFNNCIEKSSYNIVSSSIKIMLTTKESILSQLKSVLSIDYISSDIMKLILNENIVNTVHYCYIPELKRVLLKSFNYSNLLFSIILTSLSFFISLNNISEDLFFFIGSIVLIRTFFRSLEIMISFLSDITDKNKKTSSLDGGDRLKLAMFSLLEIILLYSATYRFISPIYASDTITNLNQFILCFTESFNISFLKSSTDIKELFELLSSTKPELYSIEMVAILFSLLQIATSLTLILGAIAKYIGSTNDIPGDLKIEERETLRILNELKYYESIYPSMGKEIYIEKLRSECEFEFQKKEFEFKEEIICKSKVSNQI